MTGEQLLYGLWAIFPEVVLLLLGILVISIDLIKRNRANGAPVRLSDHRRRDAGAGGRDLSDDQRHA